VAYNSDIRSVLVHVKAAVPPSVSIARWSVTGDGDRGVGGGLLTGGRLDGFRVTGPLSSASAEPVAGGTLVAPVADVLPAADAATTATPRRCPFLGRLAEGRGLGVVDGPNRAEESLVADFGSVTVDDSS